MNISLSLINEIESITNKKTFHRLLELNLSKEQLQEVLKKSLVGNSSQLFRTRRARDLLTQITKKIKSYVTTPYGKLLVHTLLPTLDVDQIMKRQKKCEQALSLSVPLDTFYELISRASTLLYSSSKKHNGTCIAFTDEEVYMELRSQLSSKFYVTLVENERDLMSIDHYEHIRFIKTSSTTLAKSAQLMPQVSIIESAEILDVAPEFITDVLLEQTDALDAVVQLQSLLSLDNSLPNRFSIGKRESFQSIQTSMQQKITTFQDMLSQSISQANFSGGQLITIVNNQHSILDYLDEETSLRIQEHKNLLQKELELLCGLSCLELFSISSLGELVVDDKQLQLLEKEYYAHQEDSLYGQKILLAKEWSMAIDTLPFIVEELYQYDLLIGLREFIRAYDLSLPEITKKGISFVYGKNMNIKDATPVAYTVGCKDQVAIITGANSGGKTTLLELLGQIQILTHMGLYVPAKEVKVGLVDEIYYFSKNKGSLSAGAFETLLKQFADISTDHSRKLILADEIESVTEPDVAAKIIKGIISHLRRSETTTLVLVTHMGRELEELEVQGRFDGIEAKGLDADLNLVVDRNPIIGRIARSTPQLIIERLAQLHQSPFYTELRKLVT